ncbi:EAL domain-containing protein [Sphingomonas sp. IW22]|uniref:bifunctional diguanylate cyclase/phosphodiesterase n=1 Tax=Sphingomonas sp. IW22 TaxID=3242489 RepID=UPI0035230DDB
MAVAALSAGVGIWATHFVAMLAYDGNLPLHFDVGPTILSALVAILFFWVALLLVGARPTVRSSILAGAIATGGIGAMHFIGMSAITAPQLIRYDWLPIAISFGIVWALFALAFVGFGALGRTSGIVVPAMLSVLGVIALHFTAMSATTLVLDPTLLPATARDPIWMVSAIMAATLGLILVVLAGAFLDRMLTDLKGLTEATLEGLAIVSDGGIVEVNRRLAAMLCVDGADVIGTTPSRWFVAADGLPIDDARDRPVEACVSVAMLEDQWFEVATHSIEYRGRSCQVLAVRDLTERKRFERRIQHLASHDALTQLPNRGHFTQALEARVGDLSQPFALIALDLDRFKAVNDIFGHAAGDEVLCRVTKLLRGAVRGEDLVARLGGDEFVILASNIDPTDGAQQLAQRILQSFASEMDVSRDPMAVGVSIGIAVFPRDGSDAATLRQNADIALYRAKESGRGQFRFFDTQMDMLVRERRELEHDLRQAIAGNEFHLVFQPLVSTARGAVMGYEALLRWHHPVRGEVPPDVFIPIAEDTGAIVPIGEWVLKQACRTAAGWPGGIGVAVNVSPVQFRIPNLPAVVAAALEESGLAPERLELEVTESAFLRSRDTTLATLHAIKAMGVRVAMDDFGTGYSSLSNLQAFPFDKIKIDRSFVSSVEDDDAARSIVRAIVGLGKSLNLPVVAEGVETEAQRLMVMEEGCPQAQGYLFGMPSTNPERKAATLRSVG